MEQEWDNLPGFARADFAVQGGTGELASAGPPISGIGGPALASSLVPPYCLSVRLGHHVGHHVPMVVVGTAIPLSGWKA